jgi:radical SAM-linked protein
VKAQRLRLTFERGEEAKELSHLEVMRSLEQAVRGAGLPLAYSEGKRPSPQLSIAAPLPVGVTSTCELADVYLSERVALERVVEALPGALTEGLRLVAVEEMGLGAPALQTQVRWAEYEVDVPREGRETRDVRSAISDLLVADAFPWEHQREKRTLRYDLRPLIMSLTLEEEGEGVYRLAMRLRVTRERSGRADQVVAALGLGPPLRTHRRRLFLDRTPAAVRAYRATAERLD